MIKLIPLLESILDTEPSARTDAAQSDAAQSDGRAPATADSSGIGDPTERDSADPKVTIFDT